MSVQRPIPYNRTASRQQKCSKLRSSAPPPDLRLQRPADSAITVSVTTSLALSSYSDKDGGKAVSGRKRCLNSTACRTGPVVGPLRITGGVLYCFSSPPMVQVVLSVRCLRHLVTPYDPGGLVGIYRMDMYYTAYGASLLGYTGANIHLNFNSAVP